ncbi:ATP-NAD kinase [Aureobasidium pullulans]|uniref:ATP-NAD kinase n=1 Tax=Aureobasidium pullulans TaxID=5580 RepID=A0A4S9LYF8_AURPU|nr:ATP-NAD kinase [Aureobasidium pullulans]
MSDWALDALAERVRDRKQSFGDMSSDDGHEALEVVFEEQPQARRKSSIVKTNMRPGPKRNNTSCIVHLGLEEKDDETMTEPSEEGVSMEKPADKLTGSPPNHAEHTQSRLLTKKQLSDMAFGIRELSKRLGRVKLMLKVKNVFVLTKLTDATLCAKAAELTKWLLDQKEAQYTVYVQDKLQDLKSFDVESILEGDESKQSRLKYWDEALCKRMPHKFDIVLALGGDGTVLFASLLFQRIVPPVLSFAMGSLGFLTKFDFARYQTILPRAFNDGITVSLRLRFEGTIMRSIRREGHSDEDHVQRRLDEELVGAEADDHHTHKPESAYHILNEIVLDRGPSGTMVALDVYGDEECFTTIAADGLIVATPTGSTAYNLAAGGSLCHPDNPVILLTAIAAHTLNFRPIILPDTMVLRIGVPYDARSSAYTSFDGKYRTELKPGDYVTISASRFPYPSVLPLNKRSEDWIESISRSLDWNSRAKQKPYTEEKKKDGEGKEEK